MDTTMARVPYADVLVDAGVVGLQASQVEAVEWAAPQWAEGGQVRVGAAVWVIESFGRRIVVDPAQAADGILRTGPDALGHQEGVAAALAHAGYPRESIDTVIASHLDGIGMIAWVDGDGGWSPFFPEAEVLISRREYGAIVDDSWYRPQGSEALVALHDQGVVTTVADRHVVTPDVTVRYTGGHSPGHQVVEVAGRGADATMVGHLALSPVHCAIEIDGHVDAPVANAALRELRESGRLLVGPLWPAPGAARWNGREMRAEAP